MKICAACHANLPKERYSKKQWKLDQRRCKVCITNNQEVQQPISLKRDNNDPPGTKAVIKYLEFKHLKNIEVKTSDEELFKHPPNPYGDCPICFIRLPTLDIGRRYMSCCGKIICSGCVHAPLYDDQGNEIDNEKCPFCRVSFLESDEETIEIERLNKRMEAKDPVAIFNLGVYYRDGMNGLPQDYNKALEFMHRAAELGLANAYSSIGSAYNNGEGVEVDKKKAVYYWELAAIGGNVLARRDLGNEEIYADNMDRAVKHWIIAAGTGDDKSLEQIKLMYSNGDATKEEYTKALLSYQIYLSEIKSSQRDKAAAAYEDYRYY